MILIKRNTGCWILGRSEISQKDWVLFFVEEMLTEVRQIEIQRKRKGNIPFLFHSRFVWCDFAFVCAHDAGGKCMRLCLKVQMVLQAAANRHHFLCHQKNRMEASYPQFHHHPNHRRYNRSSSYHLTKNHQWCSFPQFLRCFRCCFPHPWRCLCCWSSCGK